MIDFVHRTKLGGCAQSLRHLQTIRLWNGQILWLLTQCDASRLCNLDKLDGEGQCFSRQRMIAVERHVVFGDVDDRHHER